MIGSLLAHSVASQKFDWNALRAQHAMRIVQRNPISALEPSKLVMYLTATHLHFPWTSSVACMPKWFVSLSLFEIRTACQLPNFCLLLWQMYYKNNLHALNVILLNASQRNRSV